MINTALVLSGGLGTRLRSIVNDRPKVLSDINGRPFLDFIFDHFIAQNLSHVILLTGYKGKMIASHYGDSYKSLSLRYIQEDTPLGTGGAIKNAVNKIKNPLDQYLIVNGDTYFPADYSQCLKAATTEFNYIFSTKVAENERYGTLDVDNESKKILNFIEKAKFQDGLINSGSYYINSAQIAGFSADRFSLEHEYFSTKCGPYGNVYCTYDPALFVDIGIPSDYYHFKLINE